MAKKPPMKKHPQPKLEDLSVENGDDVKGGGAAAIIGPERAAQLQNLAGKSGPFDAPAGKSGPFDLAGIIGPERS
jgi:hypothetical protein